MKEFLEDYVQMMAEADDIKLTKTQLKTIVNNLMEANVIWDILDEHINYEFDDMEVR